MTASVYEILEIAVQLLQKPDLALLPADCSLVIAYENDIKPYPVEKPILAFSVDRVTIGAQLVQTGADGEQTVTRDRPVEGVVKVSIFVPYGDGPEKAQTLFKALSTALLFNMQLAGAVIDRVRAYSCDYIRDCGALVLDTDFTLSYTLTAVDDDA